MLLKKYDTMRILWISIVINIVFMLILLFTTYKYREEICQKYINWNGSAEIVMFGDSHTANGKWNFTLERKPVLRLGWSGYTSEMLAGSISRSIAFKPKFVFILCGGNDIGLKSFTVEQTMSNFKFMVKTLKSNAIKPVFEKLMYQHNNAKFNKVIDAINASLAAYCLKENIDLVDIGKKMNDSTGLRADLTEDNLHLNEKGYAIWSNAINTYLRGKY